MITADCVMTASTTRPGEVPDNCWHRNVDRWLASYLRQSLRWPASRTGPVHVLLCIADHFEPSNGGAMRMRADERMQRWLNEYPRQLGAFQDSDGRPPKHSFFYPLDEYIPEHVDQLADFCRQGWGEMEFHLHHHDDCADNLANTLQEFRAIWTDRHGVLARHRTTGERMFGFIHGNWALDNSRPDGRWCGVNNELDVLRTNGCYADFTLPSAPSAAQTSKINSIYYAVDDPERPKSHDDGVDVGSGSQPENGLMMIQGPLVLDWSRLRRGRLPGIENGCLQSSQAPTMHRLDLWMSAAVRIAARPDWLFVKLHSHGAPEGNSAMMLGKAMTDFHAALRDRAKSDSDFHFHYVSAREMYNLARAAESGWAGSVETARDFELVWDDCS